jgi:O-antigen ligase
VRYEYWRVALDAFWDDPVLGTGPGGFRVVWRKERTVPHAVTEVHSLPLGMLTELGIPGLAFLLVFLGGIVAAGRRALRQGAPIAPGASAVCVAWLLHATIDWDWQLPAVTLPALILAAGLLAADEDRLPGAAPADWTSKSEREPEPLTAAAG